MRSTGAIAQLGERLNGIQEVSGSIPLGSTRFKIQHVPETGKPRKTRGFPSGTLQGLPESLRSHPDFPVSDPLCFQPSSKDLDFGLSGVPEILY